MRAIAAFICGCLLIISPAAEAGTLARFRTALGDVEVDLLDVSRPSTVQNFIRYVRSGLYADMFIHRWEPGFVIQGGGFQAVDRNDPAAGVTLIPTFPPITNEFGIGRIYKNVYATIAMARVSGQTNSATSQWFFNLADNPDLDVAEGGYTVFGHVLRGTNILERFNVTSTNNGIYRIDAGGALNHLPVLAPATNREQIVRALVYVDVSLLTAQITRTPGGLAEISWPGVAGKTNHIEVATQLPPAWTELAATNGTGDLIRFIDPESAGNSRFYRLRVDF